MDRPLNILVEVSPLDGITPVTLRLASLDADSIAVTANGQNWLPCINQLPKQSVSLSNDGILGNVEISRGDVGFIVSQNFGNTAWTSYKWNGAFCQIWVGQKGAPFSEYVKYFEGKVSPIERVGNEAKFALLGPEADLTSTILTLEYAGTGGKEGPASLKGVAKPRCYGSPRSVEPVEIDPIHLVYQVHAYGPVTSITPYEYGAPLQPSQNKGDVATYAALAGMTLVPGEYATCLAEGLFRFGGTPTPKVSADVVMPSGNSLPDIAEALLLDASIPVGAVGDFSVFDSVETNLYLTQESSALEVLFQMFKDAGGYIFPDSNGVWQCGKFYDSTKPTVALKADRSSFPLLLDWKEQPTLAPLWRVKYGYDRCWGVHTDSDASPLINELVGDVAAAQAAAEAAQVAADAAAGDATLAIAALDAFTADGVLDPSEKKRLVAEVQEYAAEKPGIEAQADSFTVTTEKTAYQNAYTALVNYLNGLSPAYTDYTQPTAVTRSTLLSRLTDYTSARQALLNRIAALARIIWRGPWSAATTYAINDGVTFDGRSFVSATSGNLNNSPPASATNNSFWTLVSDRGATGPQGPQGEQGIQGPQGPAGVDGQSGTSVAEFNVYRRSATQPASPTGGSFNFGTVTLTAPTNWSSSIPTGADPVWVSRGVAVTNTVGGTDTPDWSTPARAFEDGQAVDAIYRRSATQPATPSASSGTPSGWYSTIASVPAGSDPIWTSFGKRSSPQANWTWEAPVRIQGIDGAAGAPGPQGPQGPAIVITKDRDFTYVNGTLTPTSQTVTFTASLQNVSGTINWTTLPNIKSGTGTTFSITSAEMGSAQVVIVTATVGTVSGSSSVSRLADPTARPSPVYRQPTPPTNVDGAWWLNNGIVGAEEIAFSDGSEWRVGGTVGARAGVNLRRNNAVLLNDGDVVTNLGTAAFIAGQGALAVQNNVNYATQVVGTYRPETFVFGCRGNSASPPTGYTEGLINTAGTNLGGFVRSYRVYYRTFGSSTWVTQGFDVFGTAGQNTAMANYLNAIPTGAVVVVLSFDEPQNNRLSGGLPAAMYRCGASRSVFGRNNFAYRAAYALIGRAGIGEGMGTEYYKGDIDNDTNAWISGTFTIVNGVPVIGYSPIRGAVDLVYPDGTRLDQLQPGEPSADVTSLITGATALTVEFDSTGTAKTGQLPRTSTYKLIRNGVEITSGVTWSVTTIEGSGTASVSGTGSGLLSVNSLPSSSRFRLQAVYAGTTRNFEVQVNRVVDAPPPASGGGTSQTDTSLLGWQNSWAVVSDTLTVNAGSAGSVNLTANFEFTSQAQQSSIETYVKFQKWNGSSWVDIGSVVASNPDCQRDFEAEFGMWLTLQFGAVNYSFTDTAPSPNQTGLQYRLLAYSNALVSGQLSTAIGANVTASGV